MAVRPATSENVIWIRVRMALANYQTKLAKFNIPRHDDLKSTEQTEEYVRLGFGPQKRGQLTENDVKLMFISF